MKWIGLTLLIFGALLALDHQNWFVPVVLAIIILGYWFFVERESEQIPQDGFDDCSWDQRHSQLHECSTSLDLSDLAPFLQSLSSGISGGYTAKVIAHIADLAARMKHEEERSLEYEVVFRGQRVQFNIGLFKDDIDEVTIRFHVPKPLADFIDEEMNSFLGEQGG